MTEFFLRLCSKKCAPGDEAALRMTVGKLSGMVGVACNLLLAAAKLAVGSLVSSVSIVADGMNNLSDTVSSVVTLVGFRLAEKPADPDHPYGHARYEYLSGLAVSFLIILIGFELLKSSWEKILHPAATEFTWVTVLVLLGSIALKLWLSLFNRRLGKQINSTALLATAADSRNDVITTSAVLAAALIARWTGLEIDGYAGAAVALFILISGAFMARDTISPLLGEAADPETRQTIVREVRSCPAVLGYHDLMVHDYGPGQRFASIHVEMDAKDDPMQCHEYIDRIEEECLTKHGIHLVIHYDPVITDDEELNELRRAVEAVLKKEDGRLSVHDFRMVRKSSVSTLIFDVSLPFDLAPQRERLQGLLKESLTQYDLKVTFDLS